MVTCDRDHRGIIGAELRPREKCATASRRDGARERLTEPPVRTDAACDYQRPEARLPERAKGFRDERIHDRVLESPRDVGTRRFVERAAAHRDDDRGLQSAEAEIESGPVEHRPREFEHAVAAVLGNRSERGPSRIAEPEELGGLVEGLAGSIILGLAENPVAPDACDFDQHRVAAGDLEGDEREFRSTRFECGSEQMPFEVMDADHRHVPGIPQRTGDRGTDKQGADESRPGGIGNPVNGLRLEPCLGHRFPDHRQEPLDVIARGKLGHDPAVAPVQLDLAEDPV